VIDIDIMIGERTEIGRGVGSTAIRLVAEAALSNPAVPFLIAATLLDNLASQAGLRQGGGLPQRQGI